MDIVVSVPLLECCTDSDQHVALSHSLLALRKGIVQKTMWQHENALFLQNAFLPHRSSLHLYTSNPAPFYSLIS